MESLIFEIDLDTKKVSYPKQEKKQINELVTALRNLDLNSVSSYLADEIEFSTILKTVDGKDVPYTYNKFYILDLVDNVLNLFKEVWNDENIEVLLGGCSGCDFFLENKLSICFQGKQSKHRISFALNNSEGEIFDENYKIKHVKLCDKFLGYDDSPDRDKYNDGFDFLKGISLAMKMHSKYEKNNPDLCI
jgi:hypothetical protein